MTICVTLPYDSTWTAHEWVMKHCPSYITNKVIPVDPRDLHCDYDPQCSSIYFERPVYINYYFSDEKDAIWFSLNWS